MGVSTPILQRGNLGQLGVGVGGLILIILHVLGYTSISVISQHTTSVNTWERSCINMFFDCQVDFNVDNVQRCELVNFLRYSAI